MKKQNDKNINNRAMLLRTNNKEMERDIEDSPIRLGGKVVSDKLLHIDHAVEAEQNDLSIISKSRNTSGSHSLSALRSFRFK